MITDHSLRRRDLLVILYTFRVLRIVPIVVYAAIFVPEPVVGGQPAPPSSGLRSDGVSREPMISLPPKSSASTSRPVVVGSVDTSEIAPQTQTVESFVSPSIGTCQAPDYYVLDSNHCPQSVRQGYPCCHPRVFRFLPDHRYYPDSMETLLRVAAARRSDLFVYSRKFRE